MSHSPAKTTGAAPRELPLLPLEEPELLEVVEPEPELLVEPELDPDPEELPDDEVVPLAAPPELVLPLDDVTVTQTEAEQA